MVMFAKGAKIVSARMIDLFVSLIVTREEEAVKHWPCGGILPVLYRPLGFVLTVC